MTPKLNPDIVIRMSTNQPINIKVGDKGRHVQIPNGFRKVSHGKCLNDDWFIDLQHFVLREVEAEDVGMDAETFDHLYRKS